MVRWKEGLSTARLSSLLDKPASCLLQSLGKVTVDHSPGVLAIVSHRLHDGLSLFYEWLHLPVMKLAASISWLHVNGDLRVHYVEGSRWVWPLLPRLDWHFVTTIRPYDRPYNHACCSTKSGIILLNPWTPPSYPVTLNTLTRRPL